MERLIEIQTVPIELQMKINNAQLQYTRGTVQMELSKSQDGGLKLKSSPFRVQIDTFEARNSLTPTAMRSIEQMAQNGEQAAYEATAVIARDGRMMMEAKMGENVIAQLARQHSMDPVPNFTLDFLPDPGPEIDFTGGELSIQYEMDKFKFDWRVSNMELEFTPGDIEFSVTQRPDLIVKYIGGPLYVPPSSDPDYEPVDVKA